MAVAAGLAFGQLIDVRDELVDEILSAQPNFQEMASLRNSLIDKATLRIF